MDKEEKARLKAAKKAAKKNKKRWWQTYVDAYKLVTEMFPWAKFLLWGVFALLLTLGIVLGIVTGHYVSWILTGIVTAVVVPMVIMTPMVSKAAYKKVDGIPGAAGGVLSQLGRGWVTSEEPVQYTKDMKNFVFRAVGKPGVVLVAEGSGDLSSLVRAAAKHVNRTVASAPVTTIYVGYGERQVPLPQLRRTITRLPKKMTAQEIADTAQRLEAIGTNALPIPKGIDPARMRMSARSRIQ